MKTCPLKTNQHGHAQWCGEKECAWWDPVLDQCLIASFLQNNANTTPQNIINTLIKKRDLDD